ncbi:hypothetical protein OJJOAM_004699 [Cupriavidus sp. H18C1]
MARTPVGSGVRISARVSGSGGSFSTGTWLTPTSGPRPSIGLPSASSTRPSSAAPAGQR